MADPADVILRLREVMNAKSDADLARRLQIGQSTISTWRKRGSVPSRFMRIADGHHPFAFGEAPAYWSADEMAALGIALTRFCRINCETISQSQFAEVLELASRTDAIWTLVREARKELHERGSNSLSNAVAAVIHSDCEDPAMAAERDRLLVEENGPAVSHDGKKWIGM